MRPVCLHFSRNGSMCFCSARTPARKSGVLKCMAMPCADSTCQRLGGSRRRVIWEAGILKIMEDTHLPWIHDVRQMADYTIEILTNPGVMMPSSGKFDIRSQSKTQELYNIPVKCGYGLYGNGRAYHYLFLE